MLSSRLSNKVALVTGIGSGIGRACALMFARHGARVMGCDIDAASAQTTLDAARAEGLDFDAVLPCDMTDPAQVKNLLADTVATYGGLDVLVNAAAFGSFKWIEEMDYERDWRRTLTGELDIVFLACQAAWRYLIARGGVPLSILRRRMRTVSCRVHRRSPTARAKAASWR